MIRIQVRPNEPLESALRRFKRQCNYAGIFRLAKKYTYYEKRSDKRRREERERIRNIQRALRKAIRAKPARGVRKSKVRASGGGGDTGEGGEGADSGGDDVRTAGAGTETTATPARAGS
jgi:small subunit ribosomal protein S21